MLDAVLDLFAIRPDFDLDVMRAALLAKIDYMDLGGLYHMTRRQLALDRDFRRIGKLAIAGMGGAPGVTNVMARALVDELDRVEAIRIYNAGADQQSYESPIAYTFSIATILDELTTPPVAFENGRYVVKTELAAFASETKEVMINAAGENGGQPEQVKQCLRLVGSLGGSATAIAENLDADMLHPEPARMNHGLVKEPGCRKDQREQTDHTHTAQRRPIRAGSRQPIQA